MKKSWDGGIEEKRGVSTKKEDCIDPFKLQKGILLPTDSSSKEPSKLPSSLPSTCTRRTMQPVSYDNSKLRIKLVAGFY